MMQLINTNIRINSAFESRFGVLIYAFFEANSYFFFSSSTYAKSYAHAHISKQSINHEMQTKLIKLMIKEEAVDGCD